MHPIPLRLSDETLEACNCNICFLLSILRDLYPYSSNIFFFPPSLLPWSRKVESHDSRQGVNETSDRSFAPVLVQIRLLCQLCQVSRFEYFGKLDSESSYFRKQSALLSEPFCSSVFALILDSLLWIDSILSGSQFCLVKFIFRV